MAAWFPQVLGDATTIRLVFGPSIAIFIISIVYRNIVDQIRLEQEQKERRAIQLETDLKFLRSQINPHFLFNVLANFVSLARKKSNQLEPSLIMLSDLMRYTVYDSQSTKVTLKKETEYLHNYIALQKLRFQDVLIDLCTDLDERASSFSLEPMLLIPFVENAFKHGFSEQENAWIKIRLSVKGNTMTFEVINNYQPKTGFSEEENQGIGISNVKTRLDFLYKNNYSLILNVRDNIFHVILTLNLL